MADAVTVTLGGMGDRAREWIAQGRYVSMSEVVREGLRALERQEEALIEHHRALIQEAIDDPSPYVPLAEAIVRVRRDVFGDE